MDDLDQLKRLRAERPRPDEQRMREIRNPLDEAIRREHGKQNQRAPSTGGSWMRRRGWPVGASMVVAAAAVVAVAVISSSDGQPAVPETAFIEGALLEFPQSTAGDVVANADQVSVVTAIDVPTLEEAGVTEPPEKDGGLVIRDVTFRLDSNAWEDGPRVAEPGEKFVASRGGWIFRSVDDGPKIPIEFVVEGGTRIEEGAQYLVPIARSDGKLDLIMPMAEFPYIDSAVRPAKTQESPLAEELRGRTAGVAGSKFEGAERTNE